MAKKNHIRINNVLTISKIIDDQKLNHRRPTKEKLKGEYIWRLKSEISKGYCCSPKKEPQRGVERQRDSMRHGGR